MVAGENQIYVVLHPIPSVGGKGVVTDEVTGKPVVGAHVVLEQQTAGGTVSVSTTTDSEGKFAVAAKVLPTTIRISAGTYVPLAQEYAEADIQALAQGGDADFGSFALSRITGVTAHVSFAYTNRRRQAATSPIRRMSPILFTTRPRAKNCRT